MKRYLMALLWLTCACAGAEPLYKLEPVDGVKIGKVKYLTSEKARDRKLEAALAKALQLSRGEQVNYLYNRVALSQGEQIFVMLVGPNYTGSGGSTALVFNNYRPVARFTLVNNPILVGPGASHGWKDLTWQVSGGGVKAHYATLHFNGKSYPENPTVVAPTPKGTVLTGTACVADELHPGVGLEFRVGEP